MTDTWACAATSLMVGRWRLAGTSPLYLCTVTRVAASIPSPVRPFAPYVAFGSFGVFWGVWGASLPAMRAQADVTDAQLGASLLFVGLGAVPAMLLTGRLLDRVGTRLSALLLGALLAAGLALALIAHDLPSLIVTMAVVGAASGAADVAINATATEAEAWSDRPILSRSHGLFSAAVVLSSLLAGGALSLVLVMPPLTVAFGVAGLLIAAGAVFVWRGTSFAPSDAHDLVHAAGDRVGRARSPMLWPLLAVGAVGAIAYAIENAFQSWGAVFLTDVHLSPAHVAAFGPAAFASVAAVARLTLAPLSRSHPTALLVGGGGAAALGSAILAGSDGVVTALLGIALAALGTAMLFPTLLGRAVRDVPSRQRGAATSVAAATAYIGFLAGPACMGLIAGQAGIRSAFLVVALVAVAFALLSAPASRWASSRLGATREGQASDAARASLADGRMTQDRLGAGGDQ